MSLLEELEAISERRDDGELLHGGHVHFIQQNALEGELILKAAIYGILEAVPERIPTDLPERIERQEYDPWDEKKSQEPWKTVGAVLDELNANLIMPVSGHDVAQVILAARKYIDIAHADKGGLS